MDRELLALAEKAGIVFMGAQDSLSFQDAPTGQSARLAMDAQPGLVTNSNAGIPAFLSTFVDPKLIQVLLSPMKAVVIAGGEVQKGNWTTKTAMFSVVEATGEVSSYGDYNNNGRAGVNVNFPERQSYHYQVFTEWGELELATAGLAKVDWANQVNIASVTTLKKYQNKTYFFGVQGLANYGMLNDPNLYAPVQPTTKTAGGTGWANATSTEILADISLLYKTLLSQANNLIDLETSMVLAMSPNSQANLTKTTDFNVNVMERIKKNFPNMTLETAPEYSTASGELVQLIVKELDGQKTLDVGFTELLRAHPMITKESSFRQKKSQGTWGAIIYRTFLIGQMLGV